MGALEKTYDEPLRSTALDHDPWSRPNLHTFRPRHELLLRALDRHLEAPRRTIADIGAHNGFFLRLSRELGFTQLIAVDYFPAARRALVFQPLAVCDIHFRDYRPPDLLTLLADLPGARVLESGYLLYAPTPGSSALSRIAKSLLWSLGLGHVRVLCATQYHVVRKQA